MILAVYKNCICLLPIEQIEGKVSGHIAECKRHHGAMVETVVHGVRNVIRQGNFCHPIRLMLRNLTAPGWPCSVGLTWTVGGRSWRPG